MSWPVVADHKLSVTYIGPNSRTERPRKSKIGTEVAHVTSDSDTTFKVKRSKVNLLVILNSQHGGKKCHLANKYENIVMPEQHRHLANKCEVIVNLQVGGILCRHA